MNSSVDHVQRNTLWYFLMQPSSLPCHWSILCWSNAEDYPPVQCNVWEIEQVLQCPFYLPAACDYHTFQSWVDYVHGEPFLKQHIGNVDVQVEGKQKWHQTSTSWSPDYLWYSIPHLACMPFHPRSNEELQKCMCHCQWHMCQCHLHQLFCQEHGRQQRYMQNACMKNPVGVTHWLLNLECMLVMIQIFMRVLLSRPTTKVEMPWVNIKTVCRVP